MKASPNTTVLVDEAYFEYGTMAGYETFIPAAVENPRIVVARTFSKCFGMAGLRIGYAIGHKDTIAKMANWDDIGNISVMALQGAKAALAVPGVVGEGRAEAQRRGAQLHPEVVRGSRLHADRLADQLHVRQHQAAVARLPRGVPQGRGAGRPATSRPTRRPTCGSRWAPWPRCRRPSQVFGKVLAAPAKAAAA